MQNIIMESVAATFNGTFNSFIIPRTVTAVSEHNVTV